ncbi:MAG: ABC transporter substrate-binding protein [Firmicutes bacterium]|nr:ABC transporter substrate-binding protein [Bacillota bacterium]
MKKSYFSKATALLLAAVLVFGLVLTGCGGTSPTPTNSPATSTPSGTAAATPTTAASPSATDASQLPPVNLTWYIVGSAQPDLQAVTDAMNKITQAKINATITIKTVDWGSYDDKMNLVYTSGEDWDLCYTASWTNNYVNAVAKGAFAPLDDLLAQYGQGITAAVPAKYFDAAKINGVLYGIPHYQIMCKVNGLDARKDLIDKYKFDVTQVKSLADMEPFFAEIKANEPGVTPYLATPLSIPVTFDKNTGYTYDNVTGNESNPLIIDVKDPNLTVKNRYETPEMMSMLTMLHDWYLKGYIRKDAASLSDYNSEQKSGLYGAFMAGNLKPGNAAETFASLGYEVVDIPLTDPTISTMDVTSSLTAINANSKNPERAMMFFNLMYTDADLYNLMCHGIEGVHYEKISADTVRALPNSAYNPGTDWMFGDQFLGYYREGQAPGTWEATQTLNESAQASPILGFEYDPTAMKTQNAQISAIIAEYTPGLATGTLDPATAIPELNAKLQQAGLADVIADAQKQLDAWRQAAGK